MKIAIGSVAAFVAVYVATLVLYASTGLGRPAELTEAQPSADGTTVTIDLLGVQPINGVLLANLIVTPGPTLVEPHSHILKDDLAVAVTSVLPPTKRSWAKGDTPGVMQLSISIAGDPSEYPFDRYRTRPITVELLRGSAQLPERTSVVIVDRAPGWKLTVREAASATPSIAASSAAMPGTYRINLQRSPSTGAFAAIILGVLVLLAAIGLVVAVQTVRNKRKFQPPMMTWYAAMLFAVMPLRNALPDAPPMGWWVDVAIVVWVVVILAFSMMLYAVSWWRHLKPEEKSTQETTITS